MNGCASVARSRGLGILGALFTGAYAPVFMLLPAVEGIVVFDSIYTGFCGAIAEFHC